MPRITITLPPITITKESPSPVPVSLVTGRNTLGVEYSDGTIKEVCFMQSGDRLAVALDDTNIYMTSTGCQSGCQFAGVEPSESPYVIASLAFATCNIESYVMTAVVDITIDGVVFRSDEVEWEEDSGEYTGTFDTSDFVIQS